MQRAFERARARLRDRKARQWKLSKIHYAALCLAAISISVGLLVLVRSGSTAVKVDIVVAKLAFKASKDAEPRLIDINSTYAIRKIENIRSLDIQDAPSSGQPFSIEADQQSLKVSALPISPGTWTSLEVHPNAGFSVNLKAKNDQVQIGAIQTGPNVYLQGRAQTRKQLSLTPEGVERFSITLDNPTVPLVLTFQQTDKYNTCLAENQPNFYFPNIRGLALESVSFGAEENPTQSIFISSVLGGAIKLLDLDRSVTLSPADLLRIKFRSAKMSRLTILPCYITISVDAIAEEIKSGPRDHLVDLRPTYLELAFKQPTVTFVTSCLATLWGFLWGLKELFVPSKKA
ncbi:hypothetical protein [Bradyrhizobium sp. CCBAU 51765]|uniref:hypothetical protein n=1 Tax=Bradyrhizobium sp. CCBAU 51765 TaxID=1325102 RepID=UPI0018872125|nr:hypothetical protein [Bradyrhizobium sp. CCBAU 51765]